MFNLLTLTEHFLFRPVLAALIVLSFSIYSVLNKKDDRAAVLMTKLDHKIPFLPIFSVPYLLFLPYLFFITVYGILVSPHFVQIAASALSIQLAAALVYYTQQTHVPRPVIEKRNLFTRLTAFIYSYDQPYCAFPSLHVAYSVYCAYWSVFLFPLLAPAFAVLSAAIIASTLFIKQHAIADVFAGLVLTSMSLALVI